MKAVDQSIAVHDPANGRFGDCFRAAIASLLELPIEKVPHTMAYEWTKDDPDAGRWYPHLCQWLATRGLTYFEFTDSPASPIGWDELSRIGFNAYHTMSGKGPRGFAHTVVALHGRMVHDPHPSRAGLIGPNEDDGLYHYGFIVQRCGA